MVRRLEITRYPNSKKGSKAQIVKMNYESDAHDNVSILVATIHTLIELPKAPTTKKENQGIPGVTASPVYRGQILDHDTIFQTAGSLEKGNDEDLLSDFEAPVIYLNKLF